ncbi:sensor histidine kinase [Litorimonas sp. WD9-15]|uniref:sensor histidine kinase n=1 Tax=Litorimonas sp. WD9-15 TaxID=3418716 RepID=UPI003D007828
MTRRQPPSLVSSLVRAAALWAVPGLIITALALTWLSRNSTYRAFDEPLESAVIGLIASVEVADDGALRLSRELPDPRYQRALSGKYWMIGEANDRNDIIPRLSSRSLYGSSLPISATVRSSLALQEQEPVRFVTDGPDIDANEALRVVARQVILPNMDTPVIVLAAADRTPVISAIRTFTLTAVTMIVILTLGLIFAVYAQVRLGLRPLFALGERIADVREGRAAEVEGVYPPEIAPLAGELNSLILHNKSVVDRAQTHVGNLAHALKTPIAVLRNEAAMGDVTNSLVVSRQTESMAQQVDHHLRRARAAARGQAIGVRAEMDPIIDGLVRTLPRIYRDKDLQIVRTGETGLMFRGAPRDLEDMVGNLMDNAAKWTTDRVELEVKLEDEGFCLVTVKDNGPGLTPEEYATALQRGARLDEATPGSGLGLSIVDDLAQAYKGSLRLDRASIGGLKAVLRLPIARDT